MEPRRPAYIPKLYITGMCTCKSRNVTSDLRTSTSTRIVYISSQDAYNKFSEFTPEIHHIKNLESEVVLLFH